MQVTVLQTTATSDNKVLKV